MAWERAKQAKERERAGELSRAGGLIGDWGLVRDLLTVSGPLAVIVWYLLTRIDAELHGLSLAVVHLSDEVALLAGSLH